MRPVIICVLACFSSLGSLEAQIFNCDGIWTNAPCEPGSEPVLPERAYSPPNPQREILNRKKLILHDLEMEVIRARRVHGIEFEIEWVKESCLDTLSVKECRELAEKSRDRLAKQISALPPAKATEKGSNTGHPSENTVVVIRETNHYIWYLDPLTGRYIVKSLSPVHATPSPSLAPVLPEKPLWKSSKGLWK